MLKTFPGTTVEVSKLEKGSSRQLFDGIFATGGITLSQVCIITGLEPYLIQNWVKRGFVTSPQNRVYSRVQLARIIIINMLREVLKIEDICLLINVIGGDPKNTDDDLIFDNELYHLYVDMISSGDVNIVDPASVTAMAERAVENYEERVAGTSKKLSRILEVMLYAHAASRLRDSAQDKLSSLK